MADRISTTFFRELAELKEKSAVSWWETLGLETPSAETLETRRLIHFIQVNPNYPDMVRRAFGEYGTPVYDLDTATELREAYFESLRSVDQMSRTPEDLRLRAQAEAFHNKFLRLDFDETPAADNPALAEALQDRIENLPVVEDVPPLAPDFDAVADYYAPQVDEKLRAAIAGHEKITPAQRLANEDIFPADAIVAEKLEPSSTTETAALVSDEATAAIEEIIPVKEDEPETRPAVRNIFAASTLVIPAAQAEEISPAPVVEDVAPVLAAKPDTFTDLIQPTPVEEIATIVEEEKPEPVKPVLLSGAFGPVAALPAETVEPVAVTEIAKTVPIDIVEAVKEPAESHTVIGGETLSQIVGKRYGLTGAALITAYKQIAALPENKALFDANATRKTPASKYPLKVGDTLVMPPAKELGLTETSKPETDPASGEEVIRERVERSISETLDNAASKRGINLTKEQLLAASARVAELNEIEDMNVVKKNQVIKFTMRELVP